MTGCIVYSLTNKIAEWYNCLNLHNNSIELMEYSSPALHQEFLFQKWYVQFYVAACVYVCWSYSKATCCELDDRESIPCSDRDTFLGRQVHIISGRTQPSI
jgi:hypothetical protein